MLYRAAAALAALLLAAPAQAQITPAEAALLMGRGINLGNTMEPPTEGAWNNGPVQEHIFDDYVAQGFATVRLPVRWDRHMGTTAPFAIDAAWMDRVEQVVDWGLERGLFVILNSHHDDWLKLDYDNPRLQARFDSLWSQVATRFADKSDRLVFEMFNEPFDPMTLAQTEDMNARVLPIIRRTNPTRIVLYSGASYSSRPQLIEAEVPGDPFVMGYYHSYDPFLFGLRGQGTWGTDADRRELAGAFDSVVAWSERTGVPAVLSEFGAIRHTLQGTSGTTVTGETDYNSRMRFYGAFVTGALEAGIPFQAWDDGGDFQIYLRAERDWNDIADVLTRTAVDGPNRFEATLRDDTLAVLTWDAASGTGLAVQRRAEGGRFATVAEIAGGQTTYVDTVRAPGLYAWRVVATGAATDAETGAVSYPQQLRIQPTVRSPFGGGPVALPGILEMENYDVGGETLTYHDTDAENVGGAYRPDEGVDIEARDDGGFHIGYVEPGEWTEYTVTVAESDTYRIVAEVASEQSEGLFSIRSGASATGRLAVPSTGSWMTTTEVTAELRLGAGERILRFEVANGSGPFNIDRVRVERLGTSVEGGVEEAALRVGPNPASGRVHVSGLAPGPGRRIEIYDARGRRVASAPFDTGTSVDVGRLASGAYVLRVTEGADTLGQTPLTVVR